MIWDTSRLLRFTSSIEVVYAIREYIQEGERYCDVVNPDTGQLPATQCPLLGGEPVGVPLAPWTAASDLSSYPLVVLGHRADNRQSLVLAVLRKPGRVYTAGPEGASPAEDHASPTTYGLRDHVTTNGGTSLVLRENGNTTLDAGGSVNIQLTDGVLRVTQDGAADDRALLAAPTVTKLNALITSYAALLSALSAAASAAAASPAPGDTFVATLNGALGAVPAVDSAVLAELQSAVLHLSATAGP